MKGPRKLIPYSEFKTLRDYSELGKALVEELWSLDERITALEEQVKRLVITRLRMSKFISDNGLGEEWHRYEAERNAKVASHPLP